MENEEARENRLRRAMRGSGFELRKQDAGKYQIVFVSELTGADLPYEDAMTLDDVARWVNENVSDGQH